MNCGRPDGCNYRSDWLPLISEQEPDVLVTAAPALQTLLFYIKTIVPERKRLIKSLRKAAVLLSSSNSENFKSDALTQNQGPKCLWASHRGDLWLESTTFWRQQVNFVFLDGNRQKNCAGLPVLPFPVQICDLINIHRLLLFTPQRLVLIENFTSYSFSLWTSFHGNKAVRTEEECTFFCLHQQRICIKKSKSKRDS